MIKIHTQLRIKGIYTLGVGMLFVYVWLQCGAYAYAQAPEYIESFNTDIEVFEDSSLEVTEHITYIFPDERHGIYRCIPTKHAEQPSSFLKERYIDIGLKSIHVDGHEVPYAVNTKLSEKCFTIGDKNETITGTHEYEIVYVVLGAISYPQYGGAEVYWDVTGNEWTIPIYSAEAKISGVSGLLNQERACYRGGIGEIGSCNIKNTNEEQILFSTTQLKPSEGLTIAQSIDRSRIQHDVRLRYKPLLLWGGIVLTLILGIGIGLYRYRTKYKLERPIIPQYEPYPDVKPMYAGFLFDTRLDPRDITAGIVYLAQQGFLKIKKTDKKVLFFFEVDDYEITLTRPCAECSDIFELQILDLIFPEDVTTGTTVSLSELKNNLMVRQKNVQLIRKLREGLQLSMKEQGLYAGFSFISNIGKMWIVFSVVLGIGSMFISQLAFIVCAVSLLVVFVVLINGRRTTKGYEALDHLKGFKDFLSVTESQRYIFHNAPERNAEHFMEYLPYAIAFGVEKQWAKTFEGITIPNPDWYNDGHNGMTFNALLLSESLGAFSTAVASASTSGASSGGGSSGGGSGGGGGGSW